jgi:hypothetical protein
MNEWEARYKALAAGITDEQLIANAEKLVSQSLLLSQGSILPFERVFNAMLHTVQVLREKPKNTATVPPVNHQHTPIDVYSERFIDPIMVRCSECGETLIGPIASLFEPNPDEPADNVKHLGMTENGTQYTP